MRPIRKIMTVTIMSVLYYDKVKKEEVERMVQLDEVNKDIPIPENFVILDKHEIETKTVNLVMSPEVYLQHAILDIKE